MDDYKHDHIATNGIKLHVVQAGPEDGPLVILLHGFPEFWYGWKAQMDHLAAQGYRVWVPDQRGYNLSDKPASVKDYNLDALAADIVGLIDAAGAEKAYLAGHDWGAAVAWWMGLKHPERLHKIVVVNAPHNLVMQRHLQGDFKQMRKSPHMFFFQLPALPEYLSSRDNFEATASSMQKTSRPGTFSDTELTIYREAWARTDRLREPINWYRAAFRVAPTRPADVRVHLPLLILWGTQDAFLRTVMAEESLDYCVDGRLERIENAGHWVLHEEPERTSKLIADFFAAI